MAVNWAKIRQIRNDPKRRCDYPLYQSPDPDLKIIQRTDDGYTAKWKHLFFIVTQAVEEDTHAWLHASVSRNDKTLPSYEDLKDLKRLCVGSHRKALQIFPSDSQHVNIGEVLHLWSCLDNDPLPDFTSGTGSI